MMAIKTVPPAARTGAISGNSSGVITMTVVPVVSGVAGGVTEGTAVGIDSPFNPVIANVEKALVRAS